jgi:hypothetical protein
LRVPQPREGPGGARKGPRGPLKKGTEKKCSPEWPQREPGNGPRGGLEAPKKSRKRYKKEKVFSVGPKRGGGPLIASEDPERAPEALEKHKVGVRHKN